MQVFGENSRFFLTLLARTAICPELYYQVGRVFAETPSRSQFLRFLVGRVPGGKPRLPGKNNQELHGTLCPEKEW
jgi:hypothetical protein